MDISVLLALDTAAFQQGLRAATDALGQFKAGADVCFEAIGKAQAKIDEAADAAAKEAAKVTEAAEAAKAEAEAEREAAKAAKEAAEAQEENATANEKGAKAAALSGEAIKGAAAAARLLPGPVGEVAGQTAALAGAARSAANGVSALGVSIRTAMNATLVLAVVAAAVSLAKAIADARSRAEELTRGIQFDNMRSGAEGAASAFSRLCSEMERAAGLQRGLDDAAGASRRLEQEKQLAELERDRNRELAAGGDADEVNGRYDAKRRSLEFSFQRDNNAAEVSGLERDRSANAERRAAIAQELDRLEDQWREQAARAMESTTAMSQTMWPQRKARYAEEAERWGGEASKTAGTMESLRAELAALEDADKVLAKNLETAQGRGALIDVQQEAANLAAAIPKKEPEPSGGAGREGAGGAGGGWGALQTSSDRLARIGGFVGGGYARQNEAREQVQLGKERNRILREIAENTKRKEEGGLA